MAYIQQQLPDTTWMTVSFASLNISPRQEATVDVLAAAVFSQIWTKVPFVHSEDST